MDPEAIAELFEGIAPVSVRRMFGGLGIWSGGLMIALAHDGELYLKTDGESVAEFAGSEPFAYAKNGRLTQTSYRRLPEVAFDDVSERAKYVALARAAAGRAARLRPPGRTRRTPPR